MGDLVAIGSKSTDEYFTTIKDYKFTTIITIGIHVTDGMSDYTVLPSHEMSLEYGLGALNVAGSVLKFGGEGE